MIDYEEELKKFEPCLDVADAEGAIYEMTGRSQISWMYSRRCCVRSRATDV